MFGIPLYAITLLTPLPHVQTGQGRAPPYPSHPCQPNSFAHVETWVFDLDNTLYPPETALFSQINVLMTDYVMRVTGADRAEADRLRHTTGGTRHHAGGLMHHHGVDPDPFLVEVHEIDFTVLTPTRTWPHASPPCPDGASSTPTAPRPMPAACWSIAAVGPVRRGLRRGTRRATRPSRGPRRSRRCSPPTGSTRRGRDVRG
jgi:hypothetical protein